MDIDIKSSLQLPHFNDNPAVSKIVRASIRRKQRTASLDDSTDLSYPWPAKLFFLNHSRLFKKLSSTQQTAVLSACNDFIISESYFIEKAGLAYCAKMIFLAETTEARQMYGLIASDEAVHLQWLTPYVKENLRTAPQGKFIYFIGELIEHCNANTLYFLVQTILEGWGISYYKTLAATCQLPELQKILFNIVKDEAIHHKTGIALFNPKKLSLTDDKLILDSMKSYAEIVKLSTQSIVSCIEKVLGKLSLQELNELFEDLQTEMAAIMKLAILKNLMLQPATEKSMAILEEQGYFTPYTATQCAEQYWQKN